MNTIIHTYIHIYIYTYIYIYIYIHISIYIERDAWAVPARPRAAILVKSHRPRAAVVLALALKPPLSVVRAESEAGSSHR